jgi:hypothetical protein
MGLVILVHPTTSARLAQIGPVGGAPYKTEGRLCDGVRDPTGFHSPNLLEDGYDIRTIQELLGHKEVATTMICTHVHIHCWLLNPTQEIQNCGYPRFYRSSRSLFWLP